MNNFYVNIIVLFLALYLLVGFLLCCISFDSISSGCLFLTLFFTSPSPSPFCRLTSSPSLPGRRGNPWPGGGSHRKGFGRIWLRIYTASSGRHPGDSASSLDPGVAPSSPHPDGVASSLHPAAWALSVGSCTCRVSRRCILSRFCT